MQLVTIFFIQYYKKEKNVFFRIGEKNGFLQVGPKKYFMFSEYAKYTEDLYNFEARSDDIWVATFPRSGTTWTQELVWLIANDLDFTTAKQEQLTQRFPYFEWENNTSCFQKTIRYLK